MFDKRHLPIAVYCFYNGNIEECVLSSLQVAALLALNRDAAARFQHGLGGGSIGSPAPVSSALTATSTQSGGASHSVTRPVQQRKKTSYGCCGGNEYGGCCSY